MTRLKDLRLEKQLNMREVASKINIPYTTYVNYEKGTREPSSEMLVRLGNFYNVSVDYLIGRQITNAPADFDVFSVANIMPMPKTSRVPVLGSIACGVPILANQNIDDYIETPDGVKADFALKCKGDSMTEARINDGDIVFIRQQQQVENGEIAAVLIDNEATLKKFYFDISTNRVVLQAANPSFLPIVYVEEEISKIRILGKAIAFLSIL